MSAPSDQQLFFVINQHVLDGSAHALYCFRHCWWLAKSRPDVRVHLLFPGRIEVNDTAKQFGLPALGNLSIQGLTALRRSKGRRGLTLNVVFYVAVTAYLMKKMHKGDFLMTASFAKLFRWLLARRKLRQRCLAIYDTHQLCIFDDGDLSKRAKAEFAMLERVDAFVATTGSLSQALQKRVPGKPVAKIGLACGFSPELMPPLRERLNDEPFRLGYFGALYGGQGVDWLVENWQKIASRQNVSVTLDIFGGSAEEVEKMKQKVPESASKSVTLHGGVPSSQIGTYLAPLDALVIPCLSVGRMPFVAITKSYDYLGMNRPVLASDLPSVVEVLLPQVSYSFHAGDVDSMAQALSELISNPMEAFRRATAAAALAKQHSWMARAEQWWKYIETTSTQLERKNSSHGQY